MKDRKDHQAAAQEAFEEAGVSGRMHKHPMGAYTYLKEGVGQVRVMVYMLEVEEEHDQWPECSQRERRWMSAKDAADRVAEAGLVEIIERLDVAPLDS